MLPLPLFFSRLIAHSLLRHDVFPSHLVRRYTNAECDLEAANQERLQKGDAHNRGIPIVGGRLPSENTSNSLILLFFCPIFYRLAFSPELQQTSEVPMELNLSASSTPYFYLVSSPFLIGFVLRCSKGRRRNLMRMY